MTGDAWTEAFLRRAHRECPVCRHSIDNLPANACPRCKSPIALGLGAVEAYLLPWGILLAGLAAATGLGLILDLAVLPRERLAALSRSHALYIWSDFLAGPIGLGLLVLVLLKRRRFCALPRSAQWTIALLATGLPVLLALFFVWGHP